MEWSPEVGAMDPGEESGVWGRVGEMEGRSGLGGIGSRWEGGMGIRDVGGRLGRAGWAES